MARCKGPRSLLSRRRAEPTSACSAKLLRARQAGKERAVDSAEPQEAAVGAGSTGSEAPALPPAGSARQDADPPPRETSTNVFGDGALGHFIPFRKSDVIEMCIADGGLPDGEAQSFRDFCRILSSLFHFEYHHRLETLKDSYAPFNPDADTRAVGVVEGPQRLERERRFVQMLREVLLGANYVELSHQEVDDLLDEETQFKIRLIVDLADFQELCVFVRGKYTRTETRRALYGLRRRQAEGVYYGRIVVYLRFKDKAYFKAKRLKHAPFQPGECCLKLFKDVAEENFEIVFPNARMSMRPVDKLVLGVPAAAGGLMVLVTKLGSALLVVLGVIAVWLGLRKQPPPIDSQTLVALGVGLATFGGYIFRQLSKVKSRRLRYLKSLAERLYFKVLDNNAGVFHRLIDDAEEEDNKEAILAYYFLCTRKGDLTEPRLDAQIERWFAEKHGVKLDFEVDDAMGKLERLELAWRQGEFLRVKPLDQAKQRIDYIWDNYFTYNR